MIKWFIYSNPPPLKKRLLNRLQKGKNDDTNIG